MTKSLSSSDKIIFPAVYQPSRSSNVILFNTTEIWGAPTLLLLLFCRCSSAVVVIVGFSEESSLAITNTWSHNIYKLSFSMFSTKRSENYHTAASYLHGRWTNSAFSSLQELVTYWLSLKHGDYLWCGITHDCDTVYQMYRSVTSVITVTQTRQTSDAITLTGNTSNHLKVRTRDASQSCHLTSFTLGHDTII